MTTLIVFAAGMSFVYLLGFVADCLPALRRQDYWTAALCAAGAGISCALLLHFLSLLTKPLAC